MRGLSLLALLVVIAIMFILWTQNASTVSSVKKNVEPQVQRIAGQDTSGRPVSDTYTLASVMENGRLRGVRVSSLAADSIMRSSYGLKEGDVIIEAGGQGGVMMSARDTSDAEMLKAQVMSAYQYNQPLVVERDGKKLTLQPSGNSAQNPLDQLTKPK